VQPQWVYDSINRQRLLPTDDYTPASVLPPHLSPFIVEGELDYVPPEREKQLQEQEQLEESEQAGSVMDTADHEEDAPAESSE